MEFGLEDLRLALNSRRSQLQRAEAAIHDLFPVGQPVFVDSGRVALYTALKAMRLEKGAKVGVPLYTCEAVFEAIVQAGCTPVFLDVTPDTFSLDPRDLERKRDGLQAIVPIHVFGHAADMDAILAVGGKAKVIEDCAHGLGSEFRGKHVGGFGDASFYSFRPGKPLSVGKMGLLLCKDAELSRVAGGIARQFPRYSGVRQIINSLKEFGRGVFYQPPWFGSFSLPVGQLMDERLDLMGKSEFDPHQTADGTLAIFAERLQKYPIRLNRARENAKVLSEAISSSKVLAPSEAEWATHTYFQFALRFQTEAARDGAAGILAGHGIDSIKFYHDSPQFALRYGYKGDCPVAESVARTVLTIPCYGRLPTNDVERISDALKRVGGD